MNVCLPCAALLCLAAPMVALAQSGLLVEPLPDMTPLELQRAYLACDAAANQRRLEMMEAARCSLVAERLKQKCFEGDFDKMLAWWRSEREAAARLAKNNAAGR